MPWVTWLGADDAKPQIDRGKKMRNNLTQARLKELLDYDPETGVFTWRVKPKKGPVNVGDFAGTRARTGYFVIRLDRVLYLRHRLAWLYQHGSWPTKHIDHISGVPGDDRITNLRECTMQENQQNLKRSSANTSGFTGVHWHKQRLKWSAGIRANGIPKFLGLFGTKDEANSAYLNAKAQLHTFQPTPRDTCTTTS